MHNKTALFAWYQREKMLFSKKAACVNNIYPNQRVVAKWAKNADKAHCIVRNERFWSKLNLPRFHGVKAWFFGRIRAKNGLFCGPWALGRRRLKCGFFWIVMDMETSWLLIGYMVYLYMLKIRWPVDEVSWCEQSGDFFIFALTVNRNLLCDFPWTRGFI